MSGRDHYEVLGLTRGASARDIRRAYRALALRYHPDVYSGANAESRFREITDAYEVLHDPAQRARYDRISFRPRALEDSAAPWPTRPSSRDVPRFLDEDPERRAVIDDDLIGALLREMFPARPKMRMPARARSGEWWPRTPSSTTEVWRWP
jgi:curved DNA-binding protein CbpA